MLKIINGTFENGCGITIHDTETDNYYHKVVYKNSVEINGKLYYKEDFSLFTCAELLKRYKTMTVKEVKEKYKFHHIFINGIETYQKDGSLNNKKVKSIEEKEHFFGSKAVHITI